MTTEEFIALHRNDNVRQLALTAARYKEVDMKFALEQISGWQQAQRKLPSWAAADGLVFPPHINMEQCSSEATARYKAALAQRIARQDTAAGTGAAATPGGITTMADLTGGFGVDFTFMAKGFDKATYIECNPVLCDIARNNFARLGLPDAAIICADSTAALATLPCQTLLYADPARRDSHGGKMVLMADCTPDITSLLPLLFKKARLVMVKLSPMLDWHKAIADLDGSVAEVHIVALQGECKELLLVLDASLHGNLSHPVRIVCADMVRDNGGTACGQVMPGLRTLTFEYELHTGSPDESAPSVAPAAMLRDTTQPLFLHEPNAAVMKAGCFGRMAERFGVMAVSRNSHLFLARSMAADFPGRTFVVEAVGTMNRKELRTMLAGTEKANIAVRNFPLSADALRKRLKLGDGGDTYIFATTSAAGDHLLFKCRKGKEGD